MKNLEITNKKLFSMLHSFMLIHEQSFKYWLENDTEELWVLAGEEEFDIDKIMEDIYEKTLDLLGENA